MAKYAWLIALIACKSTTVGLLSPTSGGSSGGSSTSGSSTSGDGTATYTIGGTISGDTGHGLALTNAGETLVISQAATSFTFTTALADGASYDVAVATQPVSPEQTCTVTAGSGTVSGANVTNVQVTCVTLAFPIEVSVSGLSAGALVLANGSDTLQVTSDGTHAFAKSVDNGSHYAVTVKTPPANLACSLGTPSSGTVGTSSPTVAVTCGPSFEPYYPNHGAKWNDYVANDGSDGFHASDTACDPANDGPSFNACIHGGEIRVFAVAGQTSCSGLSAADSLGAFNWVCQSTASGVQFVSTGLLPGKALSDLLDWTASPVAWKKLNVSVSSGGTVVMTTQPAQAWATNTIAPYSTTAAASTIQTITSDQVSPSGSGFYTTAAAQAMVVEPGVTVIGFSHNYALQVNNDFTWVEGSFVANSGGTDVNFTAGNFCALRNVSVTNPNFLSARKSRFHHLFLLGNASLGQWNLFEDVSAQTGGGGSGIVGYLNDVVSDLRVGEGAGINFDGSVGNNANSGNAIVTQTLSLSSSASDFDFNNVANGMVLMDVTEAFGANNAMQFQGESAIDLAGVALLDNGGDGLDVISACDTVGIRDVALVGNDSGGSDDFAGNAALTAATFAGDLLAASCTGSVDSNTVSACSDLATDFSGLTVAAPTFTIASFVGAVSSDSVNASGPDGTSTASAITDFTHFQNDLRAWGGPAGSNGADLGDCRGSTVCQIWDMSLTASDTILRNRRAVPSDSITHTWALASPGAQSDCDAAAPGSVFTADACVSTYLENAIEVFDDLIGNDNGLCESGETCIYSPNIGAYQGHGALQPVSGWSGSAGAVSNVTLLQYSTNGY